MVKAINADAQPWGTELLQGRHVGAIKRPSHPSRDKSTPPAADLPVVAMDDELLVGVFVRDAKHGAGVGGEAIGWLMVVDTRTAIEPGVVPSRKASLTLHPACDVASIAPGGGGGDSALATHQVIRAANGSTAQLSLLAGGGALVRLGGGEECLRMARNVRRWFVDPRGAKPVNLAWNLPQSVKTDMYSRFGAAERHFRPGGLAGAESNFAIGGSYDSWSGPAETSAWAQAGFNLGSVRPDSEKELVRVLGEAMAFG